MPPKMLSDSDKMGTKSWLTRHFREVYWVIALVFVIIFLLNWYGA